MVSNRSFFVIHFLLDRENVTNFCEDNYDTWSHIPSSHAFPSSHEKVHYCFFFVYLMPTKHG